ncbi:MAG: SDR family NAD(P)-dependent oxidoreductase [Acidimicrobiales bacterium]
MTDLNPPPVLDLFRMDGKVAVVTGAGRGIGRGVAIALADVGAHVVLSSRTEPELDDARSEILARGGSAEVRAGDITDPSVVEGLVAGTVESHGRLDTWVTNAGGSEHQGNFPFSEFPLWHWDAQIQLNLRPHFVAGRACMEVMQPGASIIGISSIASLRAAVNFAGYGAAKAGMNNLTQTMAVELAPMGIRANSVLPGNVPTRATTTIGGVPEDEIPAMASRIPLGRLGLPIDIAAAVVWLASDAASWVTGQNVVVAGGQ